MGYYDEFEPKQKPKKNTAKWAAVILVSALAGSGATAAYVPFLVKKELSQQALPVSSSSNSSGSVQQVSYQGSPNIVQAVNKVKSAVVGVVNLQKVQDPFNLTAQERTVGEGSGILFDKQGDIVTNNHVVAGAQDVQVVIQDQYLKAKVIGTDPVTDLAVVKLTDLSKIQDIQPAQFGNSDQLQIGEPAIAIGNPMGIKFAQTVTSGIISAVNRQMPIQDDQTGQQYTETYLQTDAAINPGNSGGALCDISGNVIGINSAKISSTGIEGLGFAIPINNAIPVIHQLMQNGKVVRPMIGIQAIDVSNLPAQYQAVAPNGQGVFIKSVNSAAQSQGLQPNDIITAIDGKTVKDSNDLHQILYSHQVGDTIKITVTRADGTKTVSVKLQANS